jgi:hypothetical protein
MATLFQKLQYNYSDPHGDIQELSANVQTHLASVPPLINDWQSQDISDDNVGDYFQNPVSNVSITIKTTANTIYTSLNVANGVQCSTLTIQNLVSNISNNARDLVTSASNYKDHTDRISGVSQYSDYITSISPYYITDTGASTAENKPFYTTAMGYSKSLIYILYQTDGITNTAPIFGSFTSLFVEPELNNFNINIQSYYATINSSLSIVGGNTVSSITLTDAQNIDSGVANTLSFMETRRLHDENFFTNSKNLIKDFNTVRQFSQIGESQKTLMNDHIGTEKLLTRINS